MRAANRVVVNTGILYFQMAITIGVTLYSTRLVLNALGAADYGIFNVIGGIVAMLGFLNGAMSMATQRYLSVNMGAKNIALVKKIFANSQVLHYVMGLLLVIVFEIAGLYFLENKLKIEPERMFAAKILFHSVVASTFVSIISVPYDALINARENMMFVAISNILESILKLGIAVYLFFTFRDRLVVYGFLLMMVVIVVRLIKRWYCKRKYEECRASLKKEFDKNTIKELTSFAGWNLFGAMCGIFRNQGIAIVLNLFYGTIVNAAYGIANQISGQLSFLSVTMMKAVRPQMMKSEGAGDRDRMLRLSIFAGKFSFYLFSLLSIPLFVEMPWVLKWWLKNVPEHTVLFCRLILILSLIQQLSMGIMSATQAIGKIKVYQTVAGSIQLLTLPTGYLMLKIGYPSYSILVVALIMEIIASAFRIYYFNYLTSYSIWKFVKNVILAPFVPFIIAVITSVVISLSMEDDFFRVIIVFTGSVLAYCASIYWLGTVRTERQQINVVAYNVKNKLLRK